MIDETDEWVRKQRRAKKKQTQYKNRKLDPRPKRKGKRHDYQKKYYQTFKPQIRKKNSRYYKDNKAAVKWRTYKRRAEWYYRLFKIKVGMRCHVCGEDDTRVLDLHHIDPATKVDSVSALVNRNVAWDRIEEELAKCEPICANCHRIEHSEERRRWDFWTAMLAEKNLLLSAEFLEDIECTAESLTAFFKLFQF